MRPWVQALNSTVDTIKILSAQRGAPIDEAAIAEKMGMTEAEFRACLSGKSKVPHQLMVELWPAYEYLLKEVVRADKVRALKERIALVHRRAEKVEVEVTDEEIARRAGISPDELKAYLDGSIEVPEGLLQTIFEAFRSDLFKNVVMQHVTLHSVEYDEHLDLPDEDEFDPAPPPAR
jgi:predicted transcriptional regulator